MNTNKSTYEGLTAAEKKIAMEMEAWAEEPNTFAKMCKVTPNMSEEDKLKKYVDFLGLDNVSDYVPFKINNLLYDEGRLNHNNLDALFNKMDSALTDMEWTRITGVTPDGTAPGRHGLSFTLRNKDIYQTTQKECRAIIEMAAIMDYERSWIFDMENEEDIER